MSSISVGRRCGLDALVPNELRRSGPTPPGADAASWSDSPLPLPQLLVRLPGPMDEECALLKKLRLRSETDRSGLRCSGRGVPFGVGAACSTCLTAARNPLRSRPSAGPFPSLVSEANTLLDWER